MTNALASTLSDIIRARLDQTSTGGSSEIRLIFLGPPLELLEQVFSTLLDPGQPSVPPVPIVFQVPELADGERNPPIGVSGRCDGNHILDLRNSPSKPTYLALIAPGQHSNRSVDTSTDKFGMSPASNGGNVPFEVWWADEFIQELVTLGIARLQIPDLDRDDARSIIEHAASAADDIDTDRTQRRGAWRVLSRVFDSAGPIIQLAPGTRLSLACGVPPMLDGKLSGKDQASILDKIADAMADGLGIGVQRIKDGASEEDAVFLTSFLDHIRAGGDLPAAFARATAAFYAPGNGLVVPPPPEWWIALTFEKWSDLLTEEASAAGDILMVCSNGLIPLAKGMPVVVSSGVTLEFETKGLDPTGAIVTIERTPGGVGGKQIGQVPADSGTFFDESPPSHRTPMRYVGSADGFKPGAIKVVSLASWQPGLFVACRLARKLTPPRKPPRKTRGAPDWETTLSVPGAGRYELLVFAGPGIEIEPVATGLPDEGHDGTDAIRPLPVRQVPAGHHQLEVEADGNYQVDLKFSRDVAGARQPVETCRVFLAVEDVIEIGCRSEFERLIRINRRVLEPSEAKSSVQLDRGARASSLQEWMLFEPQSFMPIVLAEDYVEAWVQPAWGGGAGPVFSTGTFLQDPRPSPSEFTPPAAFVQARRAIAERIRGEDQSGLAESATLGKWIGSDEAFKAAVETYLGSYQSWLEADPDVACWVDVAAVTSLEADGRTLSRIPDAILLSPLHPLRIAWHCVAQQAMIEADELDRPCPAASVLDPDCIPDVLEMSIRSPGGIEKIKFLAVENGTDYWSVLWNGNRLGGLPVRSGMAPFGEAFGISVGGISGGFSAAQVSRALDDVSDLLAAKPVIGIVVTSAGGTTDACNDGLISWCSDRYAEDARRSRRQSVGPRLVDIYDNRDLASRPDDATIANLSEDTRNRVRWFDRQPPGILPDLGIIAQLDMSEPGVASVANRSPIGHGALIRHRIRRQLPGAFLSESRQASATGASTDVLANKVALCVATLENLGDERAGMRFAPNVNALRDMLEVKKTDFVAVSSSAIDPACFLGGWLEGAYLWDYDLPSYSHRAGDTSGYYLLSRVKEADREALAKALARLPGCAKLEPDSVQDVLLEIARRGIPTIRGLAGDDSGATGDLGLFVAVRLLQDRFRRANTGHSLLPVLGGTEEDAELSIIVPVDPFRGYLSDLTRSLRRERRDILLTRPDLLAIGVRFTGTTVSIHLTPIEVKCRPGNVFPKTEVNDALEQARSLSAMLGGMLPSEGQPLLWALGFQHLLLSLVGFGMRVYSQHPDVIGHEAKWAQFHERMAAAILGTEPSVTIDQRGRLIVIDDSPTSSARDNDGDGFDETITIGAVDAGNVVAGDPFAFYDNVRAKVGDWGMLPPAASSPQVQPMEVKSEALAVEQEDAGRDETGDASPAEAVLAEGPPARIDVPEDAGSASGGVILSIGKTTDGFQPRAISLNISDTRMNQLNMGVVGDLGTGKTQLLKSLILQISSSALENRGVRPRFLIFDYKRDYSSPEFVEATGARVVKPYKLPLNLFDTSSIGETAAPWLDRFRFFADVLDKIYSGIGPVQRDKLKKAVRSAYDASAGKAPPTLYDVHAAYAELLDGKADSPMAIIDDLVDMEVFASSASDTVPFDQFLDGVVVISLDALGQDDRSKNMLVAVMLNMFYENMLRTQKRPFLGTDPQLRAIESYLLVDEADNIMRYEFDVLRKLLLQGREFGTGVILASQYLKHFKVNSTDYREPLLTWFIHKVPNVTPAELSALGLLGAAADMAERVKGLQNHQCLYKSYDIPGEIIRGLPFFELVKPKP
ncbi:ATP-binding protein [Agrobacterium rosae]|uniref:ATP-binding protein n=1 Tax=Agrobacterium rosae TaxID=1972867 RepID=UPI003BA1C4BA